MPPPTLTRIACPACAQDATRLLLGGLDFGNPVFQAYFRAFYPAPVATLVSQLALPPAELRTCPDCGTIFHGVVPSPETLATFYSALQAATIVVRHPVDPDREEQRLLELMMAVRFLGPAAPHPEVLDFGTGDGTWARLAAAAGCRVTATDTAEDAFDSLAVCGIACLPPDRLPADRFDFINIEQVFEHLPDPAAVLEKLAVSLRPGGVLKIGVPHDPRLREKLASPDWTAPKSSPASLNSVAPIEHLNAFTPAGLERLGRRTGLLPLDIAGWDLLDPRRAPRPGLRARLVRRLRDRLGQRHRPPYRLAQTRFFLRPA